MTTMRVYIGLIVALVLALASLLGPIASALEDKTTPSASPEATPADAISNTGSGAVYMQIENTGENADRLLTSTTDVAGIVEFHTMEIKDDVMVMTPLVDGLNIPAGETVALEPGGNHVMLINLTRDLKTGDTFELTLTFKEAGDMVVTAIVVPEASEDSDTFTQGDISVTGVWSRPAPILSAPMDVGTPIADPSH